MTKTSFGIEGLAISGLLRTNTLGRSLIILDRVGSTNELGWTLANDGAPHGFTILGEEQTRGRGRHGRTWVSPRGGIWMTIVFRPPTSFEPLQGMPVVGALATSRAITRTQRVEAKVRWPNDVVVNDKKIAGVLAESKFSGNVLSFVLLGLGVNGNFATRLLGELSTRSTTLLDLLGSPADTTLLIAAILIEIEQLYDELCRGGERSVLQALRDSECSRGRNVVVELEGCGFSGTFNDYVSLTKSRIIKGDGTPVIVESDSVISVQYPDA